MKTERLVIEFEHNESSLDFLREAMSAFLQNCQQLGFRSKLIMTQSGETPGEPVSTATITRTSAVPPEPVTFTPTDADLQDEFMAAGEARDVTTELDFTERAGEVAIARGLTKADFKGIKKSGKGGYTVADVMKAAKKAGK